MEKYSIRPHHMLCLQFFEGKGYSEAFVANMLAVKEKLEEGNPLVEIVTGADDLCRKCPNYAYGKCKNEDEILEHDRRVAKAADSLENLNTWEHIKETMYTEIINKNKVKEVCVQCRWSDICFKKAERQK